MGSSAKLAFVGHPKGAYYKACAFVAALGKVPDLSVELRLATNLVVCVIIQVIRGARH